MLDRHELMARFAGALVALADAVFEVLAEHGAIASGITATLSGDTNQRLPSQPHRTYGTLRGTRNTIGTTSLLALLGLFYRTDQRVLVECSIVVHLRHLGSGYFASEDTANATSAGMHMQHDLGRFFR